MSVMVEPCGISLGLRRCFIAVPFGNGSFSIMSIFVILGSKDCSSVLITGSLTNPSSAAILRPVPSILLRSPTVNPSKLSILGSK